MMHVDGVEMVGVREAARITRRTPETIRRWVWSGRLDHVKQGNRLLVSRTAVAAMGAPANAAQEAEPGRASLAAWAATAQARDVGASGSTSADLICDDRAGR